MWQMIFANRYLVESNRLLLLLLVEWSWVPSNGLNGLDRPPKCTPFPLPYLIECSFTARVNVSFGRRVTGSNWDTRMNTAKREEEKIRWAKEFKWKRKQQMTVTMCVLSYGFVVRIKCRRFILFAGRTFLVTKDLWNSARVKRCELRSNMGRSEFTNHHWCHLISPCDGCFVICSLNRMTWIDTQCKCSRFSRFFSLYVTIQLDWTTCQYKCRFEGNKLNRHLRKLTIQQKIFILNQVQRQARTC